MRLVVFTQPRTSAVSSSELAREGATCTALLTAGVSALHLRKPESSRQQVEALLRTIPSDLQKRVMLHQHHELARDYDVMGLHYPERVRPPAPLQPVPHSPHLLQSTSFHSLQQLEVDWGPDLNYAFLSPIYDSISKKGYSAAGFDPVELSLALSGCKTPLVALGGITAERVGAAADAGFDGVAVLGAVWQSDHPERAVENLLQACSACAEA